MVSYDNNGVNMLFIGSVVTASRTQFCLMLD